MNSFQSHEINDLTEKDLGKSVTLSGWVNSIRNHGGIIFTMLRDHSGVLQCVTHDDLPQEYFDLAESLKEEYVIRVKGQIEKRSEETINEKIESGLIELKINHLEVINTCKVLPFKVNEDSPIHDDAIKYRYLYLRRKKAREFISKRYQVTHLIRNFLNGEGFLEVETPMLTKTTPEGARDFLVPSRVFPGEFYALPQSPQQYKQLLMTAGFKKYFQIARALRDEDSRADRQAEHTQIDLEMSFVERDEIIALLERLVTQITKEIFDGSRISFNPFLRISYKDSMEKYGNDKPDLRFALEINELSSVFANSTFKVFQEILKSDGKIKGIKWSVPHELARSELDAMIALAQESGLGGLIWVYFNNGEWKSSIKKYISEEEIAQLKSVLDIKENDLVLLGGDEEDKILDAMGKLRVKVAQKYKLIDEDKLAFAFVVDYPLFFWNENEKRMDPMHHMFVLPKEEDLAKLDTDPLKVTSTQFDLICNGYELCSGSLRIYKTEIQKKVMKLIGLTEQEIESKFSHLLQAFDFGAPPHGGAAPGLDRLIMVLMKTTNIRDVIAFPKTQRGQDLMMESPSIATEEQLKELGLKIDKDVLSEDRVEYLESFTKES